MASITGREAFAIWAPDGVLWSEWAKPIAFVQSGDIAAAEAIGDTTLPELLFALDPESIVIVDLPGADAVLAGLALAGRGFRPVPLFNGTTGPSAVIDVAPITRALAAGAERLKHITLPRDAAPAFLLDSRRSPGGADPRPGSYDNRWVTLPQDFPSGALLASRGLKMASLVRRDGLTIPADLAHVLRRWQEHGIQIRVVDAVTRQTADNVTVPKPSRFRLAWYAAIALLGLRRSNVGGFGSVVPEHTSGGGYG